MGDRSGINPSARRMLPSGAHRTIPVAGQATSPVWWGSHGFPPLHPARLPAASRTPPVRRPEGFCAVREYRYFLWVGS